MKKKEVNPKIEKEVRSLGRRIEDLISKKKEKTGKTLNDQAAEMGIPASSLTKYKGSTNAESEVTIMQVDNLIKIANYYDVSYDFLLGLTKAETRESDIRGIQDYTGLTKESVDYLHKKSNNTMFKKIINFILSDDRFIKILGNYLLTGIYEDFQATDYFKFLPFKTDSMIKIQKHADKILFSWLLSILPEFQKKFVEAISQNDELKENIFYEIAVNSVNVKKCKEAIKEYNYNKKAASIDFNSKDYDERERHNAEFAEFLENLPNEMLEIPEQIQADTEKDRRIEFITTFLNRIVNQKDSDIKLKYDKTKTETVK